MTSEPEPIEELGDGPAEAGDNASADPCGCSPPPAAAVAIEPGHARETEAESLDDHNEPAARAQTPGRELKLVVLLRPIGSGFQARIAAGSEGCDPELRVVEVPELPAALAAVAELAAAAEARWRVQRRYPPAPRPAPPALNPGTPARRHAHQQWCWCGRQFRWIQHAKCGHRSLDLEKLGEAIQDAVVASNVLEPRLRAGQVSESDLAAIQRRREWPVRIVQAYQRFVLSGFRATLPGATATRVPFVLRIQERTPLLRDLTARIFGVGVWPARLCATSVPERVELSELPVAVSASSQLRSFLSRHLGEFEEDVRLVAHDPPVMTRVDDRDVARAKLHLGPVVQTDALAAGHEDLDVTSLAALSADGWLDVR